MLTPENLERERKEARLKFQRDQASFVEDAVAEGFEKGEIMGHIFAHQQLLKLPLTPREELQALSLDELRGKAAELWQQLGATNNRGFSSAPLYTVGS